MVLAPPTGAAWPFALGAFFASDALILFASASVASS